MALQRVGRRSLAGRPLRELGPDEDPVEVARQVCLDQLSFAPRSRAELADVLLRRGVPEEVAEQVLGRFGEVGLVDDAAFARTLVDSRQRTRGLSRRALGDELRRRGVDGEVAEQALEEVDPELEVATARSLVDRKLPATRGVEPQARARRLVGMLARKGYGSAVAYRVVREALEAEGAELVLDTDGLSALD